MIEPGCETLVGESGKGRIAGDPESFLGNPSRERQEKYDNGKRVYRLAQFTDESSAG
jgi:hypothetical protein